MHFLYPAFLFACLTLAIPVIIHLFNFRRYKKVLFSNVQFLKEVQEQQASRRNIKERLILASRLLALLFLVLAFARPYILGKDDANAGKQQVVSIFVDNSYSMQTLNREGSLLDEAKQKAKQIAAAYHINDRFQLITQDFEGKHQRLLNRAEFNDAVDAVKISPQSRQLNQVLARQNSLLDMQAGAVKNVYVLSDFQKNMAGNSAITDSGLPVSLIQLKANPLPNVAVDSVWMLNATHRPGESEKMVVRLRNYADKAAEKIPLKLIINGVQKAIGSFTVKERSAQTDTLSFSGLQDGWQRAEIQLQDNPITFDNKFYFTFNVTKQLPVLLINGGAPNKYLSAVFATDAFFAPKQVPDGNVDYAGLNAYPIIVLSDIKTVSAGLAQQLKTYVSKGGTLMVFPSVGADLNSYKAFLQPMGAAYPTGLVEALTKVSAINLQSRIFKSIFETSPQNPDLPIVYKYYALNNGTRQGEYLMKLKDGATLWQGSALGRGRVYVAAVALDEVYSNLPVHALFVPVMLRIALLSGHDQPLFYTAGNNEPIETVPLQSTEKQLVKLVKDKQTIIPEVKQQEGSTVLYLPDQLTETGIYDLKKQDSTAAVLAFNDNRSESDLSYLTSAELEKLFPKNAFLLNANKLNAESLTGAANSGLQLWKLCIILVLIFLAAETLLIRYYKTGKSNVTQSADIN
ncbi:BatA domain-containing protein [Mucilaginibacter sp. RB4R14]|uniref:BatA domain-containing protein n=1 Tax=Mucilaginibacter aurantiaciroseus TaxID=2949308 RepID=UPI002091A4F5|nr:BatA domain-containing protein [Mucilaginibacter aurantiaciroseus]MCO5934777.1 BatA domain-containing protein [Mucilaginibacter aurantiaciroseus]